MARNRPWRRSQDAGSITAPGPGAGPAPDEAPDETPDAAPDEALDEAPDSEPEPEQPAASRPRGLLDRGPVPLVRAAHPRQALATATGLGLVAALSGREAREVALVFATGLVGQAVLGWHNDLVDADRDRRHHLPRKPVAQGHLDPGTVWFTIACAVLLLVPLSISTGVTAGCFYLASVAVAALGERVLRTSVLSWLPWAASFALLAYYLSYGGWGGAAVGDPPQPAMVLLFAMLGVGVHVLRALWGLVPDNADGWQYLPLKAGLRWGASRLLTVTVAYLAAVLVALAAVGSWLGLSR